MNLNGVMARARCLLIDFDGPICSVFAGYPAADIARQLHDLIRHYGNGDFAPAVANIPGDPLETLIAVAAFDDANLAQTVADAARDAEITAVAAATPTASADEVMRLAHETGRQIVIVSNNATAAIETYLRNHDLARYVDAIAGRSDRMDPRLMKPHPYLVEEALAAVRARREDAVFVGDSITDIEAGRIASTVTIGYANKPGKRRQLTDAGAAIVIDSMRALAQPMKSAAIGTQR